MTEAVTLSPTQEVSGKSHSALGKPVKTPLLFKRITAVGPGYEFGPQSGKQHLDGFVEAKCDKTGELQMQLLLMRFLHCFIGIPTLHKYCYFCFEKLFFTWMAIHR